MSLEKKQKKGVEEDQPLTELFDFELPTLWGGHFERLEKIFDKKFKAFDKEMD
jgi:hypothetical protein